MMPFWCVLDVKHPIMNPTEPTLITMQVAKCDKYSAPQIIIIFFIILHWLTAEFQINGILFHISHINILYIIYGIC